jgi:hypothetical protein
MSAKGGAGPPATRQNFRARTQCAASPKWNGVGLGSLGGFAQTVPRGDDIQPVAFAFSARLGRG